MVIILLIFHFRQSYNNCICTLKKWKGKIRRDRICSKFDSSPIPSASGINDFTVSKEDLINAQKLEVKLSQYFDFIGLDMK